MKFKYGDQVRIKTGFYEGQEGKIIQECKMWYKLRRYQMYTVDVKGIISRIIFKESRLELAHETNSRTTVKTEEEATIKDHDRRIKRLSDRIEVLKSFVISNVEDIETIKKKEEIK